MKRIIALMLLCLFLTMTACTQDPGSTTVPTGTTPAAPGNSDPTQPDSGTAPQSEEKFGFAVSDTVIVPGTAFDAEKLPAANFVYTIPSCAIEGNDDVYSYNSFEVTAYNDGSGPVVYSIYITDPNQPTTEGLYMGDDLARVTQLYGTEYTQSGTELSFQKGNTLLILIMQDGYVTSMEYRLAN